MRPKVVGIVPTAVSDRVHGVEAAGVRGYPGTFDTMETVQSSVRRFESPLERPRHDGVFSSTCPSDV
jgi:hypothetical protein